MTIAIHQPNYFPHYPFFQKMEQADMFVVLTHCQFEKNNYQNRFYIDERWHTMSVSGGMKSIAEKKYIKPAQDWNRIKTNLKQYDLSEFDSCISGDLVETNVEIISKIKRRLGIKTPIMYDFHTDLKGTERLLDICKKYGATKYLSGVSGKNYLDINLFDGIEVIYQEPLQTKPIIEVLYA